MSRMSPRFVVCAIVMFSATAALVLAAAAPRPVAASGPHFTEFPCPSNPALMCVMKDLHNPRGLTFSSRRHDGSASDGALYVAEAGCGGNTSDCSIPAPASSCVQLPFGGAFLTRCFGLTGSISRLRNGTQERVATGFPSHAPALGGNAIGPSDLSLNYTGDLYATIGLMYDPTARDGLDLGPLFAQLARVPARALSSKWNHAGRRTFSPDWLVADIGDYEIARNPDHGDLDTNPFGLLSVRSGWIVTDAGGNSLLKVDHRGHVSRLATFQSRASNPPRPSFAPPPPPVFDALTDAVPTSVVVGPDGAYYVAELTGVPFTDARANVYRVVPGGKPREFHIDDAFLTGFKMIIDLDFDEHGNLYVLQHAAGAVQQAGPGVLIRVTPDRSQSGIYAQYQQGTRETVLPGLNRPTSVAVGPDGAVYVARGNTALGGEVIRFVPPPVAGACSSHEDCDDGNVCTQDKCDKRSGTCEYNPTHQPRSCDDGNACTSVDVCDRGVCQGSTLPNGTACSDGNACTQRDTCQVGACTGADPVVCSASDQCHVTGTCNTATGACSNPAVPDGTACADGNACTQSDSCQSGACTGANPVICSPSDQCHVAGTCDTATGACSDPTAPDGTACDDSDTCSGQDACEVGVCTVPGTPVQQIAFVSSRHNPAGVPQQNFAELYLMNPDGTNVVRLTTNDFGDAFPALSPDAKGRIVFDSNRDNAPGDPINRSDLFLMKRDGSNQQPLARGGSSASWSPDSQSIAFQRSASGTGLPINPNPGAPALDSDVFVARVCDLRAGLPPTNITNNPQKVDVDPDWRSDGTKIVFTNWDVADSPLIPTSAEIWTINPDGSGLAQLTFNGVEERAPAWSPDGTRITYMCKQGPAAPNLDNEICVMNADGTGQTQLTFNTLNDATSSFSPDGQKIIFHRGGGAGGLQIWVMNLDGTGQTQMTGPPGISLFPTWGFVRQQP